MRFELLAWSRTPPPLGQRYFEPDLRDAEKAVEVLAYAHLSVARITREGWRFLWAYYGLDGLLALGRYAGWFDGDGDEAAAGDLVRESLLGGYDPVSGLFGDYSEQSRTFELLGCD